MTSPVAWRLGIFAAVIAVMVLWEAWAPWRTPVARRRLAWGANLAISMLGLLLIRLVSPLGAVGAALFARSHGWGLLNAVGAPAAIAVPVAVVALDLAIYGQHTAFHAIPWLWRLHRVHHADEHVDASTGVRFHPAEALLSLGWKSIAICLLGAAPFAVVVFEILLSASSVFNHGNVAIPRRLERPLRWLLVTPEMHRIHHSIEREESNTNFGFSLACWDRLFGTYRDSARAGEQMSFGVSRLTGRHTTSLWWMLRSPVASARPEPTTLDGALPRNRHLP